MVDDRRFELLEDIIEGVAHGELAESAPAFAIVPRGDEAVLEVDFGDPDCVYLVTVTSVERAT